MPKARENRSIISPYTSFLLFNLVFFMLDTTGGYFQIYLSNIGLTKTMIGTVTGVAGLAALFAQPFFADIADSSKSKNGVMRLMLLITAVLYPMILLNNSLIYVLIMYTLYFVFRRFQPSLNVTMSVEYSEQNQRSYGPIRMMGAVGYGLMMLVMSRLTKLENGVSYTFFAFSVIVVVVIGILFLMPKMPGHNSRQSGSRVSPAKLVKCKLLILMLAFQVFLSIASGFSHSYFSLYFTEDMGGSNALYGIVLSVSAFVEIPFLFMSDKIINKLGARKMLCVLGAFSSLRWFVCFFATSTVTLFVAHCFNFISILETVTYSITLSKMVAPRFKTSVQTLSATIQNVASILLASFLGGFLADLVGIRFLFLISGIIVAFVTLLFGGLLLRKLDSGIEPFEG